MIRQKSDAPLTLFLVLALSFISVLFTSTLIHTSLHTNVRAPSPDAGRMEPPNMNADQRNYRYSIDDFPERWSVSLAKVAMIVEESVHYDFKSLLRSSEQDEQNPEGMAAVDSVRIVPGYQAATLSMSHQLHCIENFKNELRDGASQTRSWAHLEHCSNYLRQWAMCRADLTLEPGDFMQRDFEWDRQGAMHECLDWEAINKELALDWQTWVLLWKEHHLSKYNHQDLDIQSIVTSSEKN